MRHRELTFSVITAAAAFAASCACASSLGEAALSAGELLQNRESPAPHR